jgi:hypothetical protein
MLFWACFALLSVSYSDGIARGDDDVTSTGRTSPLFDDRIAGARFRLRSEVENDARADDVRFLAFGANQYLA